MIAGIGLTGIVGGLASSTVTTLSFARRSLEASLLNRHFSVAVILASSVMFPRLLLQIAVVNQALMKRMLVPICVTGLTGLLLAAFYFFRSRARAGRGEGAKAGQPFQLEFGLEVHVSIRSDVNGNASGNLTTLGILGCRWLRLSVA